LVLERDGEEWRMMNGAMGLRDFWEAMINAGYDPREFSPIRHPDNHLLRDSCPWPFGDIEGDFPPMNVFPIMPALTTRATWKTGGAFIDGCAEYSVVGGSSTLMNKFRRSFASVLVQIVCRQYRDISLLGALDPRVCVAVGFDPGRFHVEVRAEVRSLMRMPHIFTEIDKWRVISPRLAQISIWSPLITLYRSRGSCAGEGEEIKLPEFSVDFRNRRLSCNVESVKWQDHSSRPFICLNGVVRIGSFPGIMVAGKEGSMEDRVHNSLRTAIIGSLSVDAIDSAQPESALNCFIRLHRNFIDSDIRMFAAVVQGAKHPFIAFRCEGHFLNNPWVNNIVEPPNTYVVQLNDNVDDIWHVIQAFRSESAFMRYVVRDSPRQFIEVFLQGVMMLLTGGRVLSMETLSSENEKYLAHLGWICAYILIRRVSFANFGPDVPIEEDFMTEILSRGHYRGKHPRKQEIFGEGFDLILTMRMMTSLVSLKELWQIMRKCS
jgi:hypothetical protein